MISTQVPTKFPIPWGENAAAPYIRPIPVSSQIGIQGGAASLTDGFPPLCFEALAEGGIPPYGEDFNGILNEITAWVQWLSAGGPLVYDAAFQAAIGGYPAGAIINSGTNITVQWISVVENNMTDPDTGGAGWLPIGGRPSVIITSSATLGLTLTNYAIGLNRTAALAAMTINLPTPTTAGWECRVDDLAGNCQRYPATLVPPAGHTIAGEPSWTINVNRGSANPFYYGSNIWGIR